MAKNKKKDSILNYAIIILIAMIIVLICYRFFYKKESFYLYFDKSNIDLKVGTRETIKYTVSNKDLAIKWESNNDVVTVNSLGEVTANKYGEAIVTGIIVDGDKTYSDTCYIKTYTGELNVSLEDISVADGYLLMRPNSSYNLPFTIVPSNAYITSIEYSSSNENVVIVDNNSIISKDEGTAEITMVINNQITKSITVKVSNTASDNSFVQSIDKVTFNEDEITMEIGDTKSLSYTISPQNSYYENIEWISDDPNIVTVSNGEIKAINSGNAVVKVIIDGVEASVIVRVKASNANIQIDKKPKSLIKVGEKTDIIANVSSGGTNDTISFQSSDSNIATVDQNGIITGIKSGTATITLSLRNGKTKVFNINVLPKTGSINGTGNLWGYTSSNERVPVLADKTFFQGLALSGRGVLNGNTYVITASDNTKYSYDLSTNILTANNKKVKVRIYYPTGVDLTTLNTLTYLGGDGELDFAEYFTQIASNPSIIKSSGVVALVPKGTNTSFDGEAGVYATKFMQTIINQKSYAKNSLLGFSAGGIISLDVASRYNYDKVVIFSAYYAKPQNTMNLKDTEILFYIPHGDKVYNYAKSSLSAMKSLGYTNVTIVTNSNELVNMFSDTFLVINPGSLMQNGHLSVNVGLSGVIAYAND